MENILQKLPKNSYFIFREYYLDKDNRFSLAKKLKEVANKRHIKFIVAMDFDLARKVGADGVHFSDHKKLPFSFFSRNLFKKNFIFSYSCHNLKSALFSHKNGFDLNFISPIFTTTSHADSNILGKIGYLKILHKCPNILPLGGINNKNITFIKKSGALGFGAIDYFNYLKDE